MKTFVSNSLEDTAKIASDWLALLGERREGADEATLVGLSGHLGAGKTAFVKRVAKSLGVSEEVTSPTFIIMKAYEIEHPVWHRLIHIDAYRLERREELEALDWEGLTADKNNLILIEWPANVGLDQFKELCDLRLDIQEGKHRISIQ